MPKHKSLQPVRGFRFACGLSLVCCSLGLTPPAWALDPSEPAEADQPFTVVLDPGHGGRDQGLVAKPDDPRSEKVLMLELAAALKNSLEKKGFKVYLTRGGDESFPLSERMSLANRKNADVFLSLHLGRRGGNHPLATRFFLYRAPAFKAKRTRSLPGRLVAWDEAQVPQLPQSRKLGESLRTAWTGRAVEMVEIPLAMLAGVSHPAVMAELPPPAAKDWRQETECLARGIEQYLSRRREP